MLAEPSEMRRKISAHSANIQKAKKHKNTFHLCLTECDVMWKSCNENLLPNRFIWAFMLCYSAEITAQRFVERRTVCVYAKRFIIFRLILLFFFFLAFYLLNVQSNIKMNIFNLTFTCRRHNKARSFFYWAENNARRGL